MSQYLAHHSRMNRKQSVSQYAARHSRRAKAAADPYVSRHSLLNGKPVDELSSRKGGWTRFLVPMLFLFGPLMAMFGLGAGRALPGDVGSLPNANVWAGHTSGYGGRSDLSDASPSERTLVTRRIEVRR